MRNSIISILLVFCSISFIDAQTIKKFSIDNGGASATLGGIELLYTIGEVNVQEFNIGGIHVSEGFINGDFAETLSIEQINFLDNSLVVYPNPAFDIVHIKSDIDIERIEVYDMYGKIVLKTENVQFVKLKLFSSGAYIFKFFAQNKVLYKRIIVRR